MMASQFERFKHIFKPYQALLDKSLNEKIMDEGYVVMDFLNSEEINNINLFLNSINNFNYQQPGFHVSCGDHDLEHRARVDNFLKSKLSPKIPNIFSNYELFIAAHVLREPTIRKEGILNLPGLHFDHSLVDESKYRSYAIWCPLLDTTIENGGISIIPKTHLAGYEVRTVGLPNFFSNIQNELYDHLIPLNLKAGEAVIFDTALLHHTGPNYSNKRRNALLSYLRPVGAKTYYYFEPYPQKRVNNNAIVERWEMEDIESLEHIYGNRPVRGTLLETFEYNVEPWTINQFKELIKK